MAQRFVELTDAETNRAVWIDADAIVAMRETIHGNHIEVTALTYKVGNMREVAVVKQQPSAILYMMGQPVQTPTGLRLTVALVGGERARFWLHEHATLAGSRWHRNSDGARCVVGNEEKRFVGLTFDEVLAFDDADPDVVRHVMGRSKAVKS